MEQDTGHVPGTVYVAGAGEAPWKPVCSCGWWAPAVSDEAEAHRFARGHAAMARRHAAQLAASK